MHEQRATRRELLLGGTAAALSLGAGLPAWAGQLPAARATRRRNVELLSAAELAAYEHAIQITKDRSTSNPDDPTGYSYWAGLHDNFDDTIHSGCSHFSERFFPWHRRFLADFEALLQQTDPPVTAKVTIPYWDWSRPPVHGAHFPQAFERSGSPLFDNRLSLTPPPWPATDVSDLIAEPDWSLFAGKPDSASGFGSNPGAVESGPHNHLHSNISRHMRNPATAVLDPIFWSFHAFIDLTWARWQRLHVGTGQQPFGDPSALIWFRDRSYTVGSTTTIPVDYEYDFTPDGPVIVIGRFLLRDIIASRGRG